MAAEFERHPALGPRKQPDPMLAAGGLQIATAIAETQIYNVTNMLGDALAEFLPNRAGLPFLPDVLANNYTQAVLPGLTTAAVGLSYEPCLASLGATGAAVGIRLASY